MKKCIGVAFCPPLILLLLSGCLAWSQTEQKHRTIIDMHLHAYKVADFGVGLGRTPAVCSSNGRAEARRLAGHSVNNSDCFHAANASGLILSPFRLRI